MFSAVALWDDKDKRGALAQIERLAQLPEVSFYTGARSNYHLVTASGGRGPEWGDFVEGLPALRSPVRHSDC